MYRRRRQRVIIVTITILYDWDLDINAKSVCILFVFYNFFSGHFIKYLDAYAAFVQYEILASNHNNSIINLKKKKIISTFNKIHFRVIFFLKKKKESLLRSKCIFFQRS